MENKLYLCTQYYKQTKKNFMIYRFLKTVEYAYFADVEADSVEEAKEKLEDAEWEEDDGGEAYIGNKRIHCAENYDALDEGEYEEIDDDDWRG